MTKILHITTDTNIGGAGHQVLALINAMDTAAFECEVVVPANSRLVPALAARGIAYHEVPNIADKSFSLAGVRTLHRIIKRLKPDIVHTHGALSGRIGAKFYRRCGIVHTRHSVFDVAAWKKRFPMRRISGCINNFFSHRIIAVSPAAKENLLDMGTAEGKIRVVFNGTPPAQGFTPEETEALRQKYSIPPGVFTLAILARLTQIKGHDDILDAAKAVPDALILIAGDGERMPHLKNRISSENIRNVKLLGFIDDVDEIIAVSDALLNASFGTEASSMSLVQGMSAGRPAIATDYGGNPYLVEDGKSGLITPTRKPQVLAEAITRLMTDAQLYRQLSEGAIVAYNERFTDKKMASDTEAVYREILTKR